MPEFPPDHELTSIQQLVINDIAAREQFGIDKYGVPIYADTPDDPIEGSAWGQAYNEMLDLIIYWRWGIERQRRKMSAPFAFGAIQSIRDGDWDQYLDQLRIAVYERQKEIRS